MISFFFLEKQKLVCSNFKKICQIHFNNYCFFIDNISNICSDNKSKPKNPFWQEENNPFRATAQSNHFQQPINGFCDNFSDSNQVQSFLTYSQSLDFKSVTNPNPFNVSEFRFFGVVLELFVKVKAFKKVKLISFLM